MKTKLNQQEVKMNKSLSLIVIVFLVVGTSGLVLATDTENFGAKTLNCKTEAQKDSVKSVLVKPRVYVEMEKPNFKPEQVKVEMEKPLFVKPVRIVKVEKPILTKPAPVQVENPTLGVDTTQMRSTVDRMLVNGIPQELFNKIALRFREAIAQYFANN